MGGTQARDTTRPPAPRSWLPFTSVGFGLVALIMANSLPTALYRLYAGRFGFSSGMVTVLFAVYIAGALVVLVGLGRLSDEVGRRPVLLGAVALAAVGSLLYATAGGVGSLLAARLAHGVAVGLGFGAGTAALVDLHPDGDDTQAALISTVTFVSGQALGALTSGLLAAFAPLPVRLVWLVHLTLLALAALGVWRLPDDRRRPGPGALRPQRLSVPGPMRRLFVANAAGGAAMSAVGGLYLSLVPSFLRTLLHLPSLVLAGGLTATFMLTAAVAQIVGHGLPARRAVVLGLVALATGLVTLTVGAAVGSLALFVVATLVAGGGFGLAFMGAVAAVNAAAPEEHRAQVVSAFYVAVYLGTALPVLGVGFAAGPLGLLTAAEAFAGVIGSLALLAALGLARTSAPRHADAPCRDGLAAGSRSVLRRAGETGAP